jgi:hypothetical protein
LSRAKNTFVCVGRNRAVRVVQFQTNEGQHSVLVTCMGTARVMGLHFSKERGDDPRIFRHKLSFKQFKTILLISLKYLRWIYFSPA